MMKKIKPFLGITLSLFCLSSLIIAVLAIWDMLNIETAKEILIKLLFTFGVIIIGSLIMMLITKITSDEK